MGCLSVDNQIIVIRSPIAGDSRGLQPKMEKIIGVSIVHVYLWKARSTYQIIKSNVIKKILDINDQSAIISMHKIYVAFVTLCLGDLMSSYNIYNILYCQTPRQKIV